MSDDPVTSPYPQTERTYLEPEPGLLGVLQGEVQQVHDQLEEHRAGQDGHLQERIGRLDELGVPSEKRPF